LICNGVDKKGEWAKHMLVCRKYDPGSITAEEASVIRHEKETRERESAELRRQNQISRTKRGTGVGCYIKFLLNIRESPVLVVGENATCWLLSEGRRAEKRTEGCSWIWAKDFYHQDSSNQLDLSDLSGHFLYSIGSTWSGPPPRYPAFPQLVFGEQDSGCGMQSFGQSERLPEGYYGVKNGEPLSYSPGVSQATITSALPFADESPACNLNDKDDQHTAVITVTTEPSPTTPTATESSSSVTSE
jgi:hypothetical protein